MVTDCGLMERVRAELALEPGIDIENVEVEVDNGQVTLVGRVANLGIAQLAASCVMRVEGVHVVINKLCVQFPRHGFGRMDDERIKAPYHRLGSTCA
jgi:osmotically-inducible protein OsmY